MSLADNIAGAPTEVILGSSSTGDVLFTNAGGTLTFGFTGDCGQGGSNCLAGLAYYGSSVGSYSMWSTGGPLSLGTPNNNVYPVNMNGSTINFAFTAGSYNLDGTIILDQVASGTQTPVFNGGLTISSTNLPGYSNGGYAGFDFIVNLGNNPSLESVYDGQYSTTDGYLSSGEVPPSVPEPGSIVLLGSGSPGLRRDVAPEAEGLISSPPIHKSRSVMLRLFSAPESLTQRRHADSFPNLNSETGILPKRSPFRTASHFRLLFVSICRVGTYLSQQRFRRNWHGTCISSHVVVPHKGQQQKASAVRAMSTSSCNTDYFVRLGANAETGHSSGGRRIRRAPGHASSSGTCRLSGAGIWTGREKPCVWLPNIGGALGCCSPTL